jgi:DNA-binding GntR family transcriptional regulator
MLTVLEPEKQNKKPASRWTAVYRGVKDAIIGRRLLPGTKLPEDELAAIYAVSRTVVRAALQALAHDRLIRLELNRGAFVAHPSKKEARDVFEARALIESEVASIAALKATPQDIALLRRHLESEHEALHAGRDSEAIILSARFHLAVAEIADQSALTNIVRDLVSHSSLIITLYWARRDTTCQTHAHHDLVDAIEAHRPADAARLMRSHLVDLMSGLDLTRCDKRPNNLSDILS